MNIENKLALLKTLGTRELIEKIAALEDALETLLREEQVYIRGNSEHIPSRSGDSKAVEYRESEVLMQAIPGLRTNAEERKAWLLLQRNNDPELKDLLEKQRQVAFKLEDFRISREMAQKRLSSANALMHLRTAQIGFLGDK